MIVFVTVFLSACGSNAEESISETLKETNSNIETTSNLETVWEDTTNIETTSSLETTWEADQNIEIVRDFFVMHQLANEFEDMDGWKRASHCYLIHNKYDKDINIEFNTIVYDENHEEIESGNGQNLCIGAGQYGIVDEIYRDKKIYNMKDYEYTYKVSDVCEGTYSETSRLKYEYTIDNKKVIVAVTNASKREASTKLNIIFFKNGNPVDYKQEDIYNYYNYKLLNNTTYYCTLHFDDIDFDSLECYPEAYISDDTTKKNEEVFVGEKAFDYIEITDEYYLSDGHYCYIIHNKSNSALKIFANGFLKDEDGTLLDAYLTDKDYVEAGQDICLTNFYHKFADNHIKPEILFIVSKTTDKHIDFANIEMSYRIDAGELYMTAKNNSSQDIDNLNATIIFMKDGVPVTIGRRFFINEELEIYDAPVLSVGRTSKEESLRPDEAFDDVRIYPSVSLD